MSVYRVITGKCSRYFVRCHLQPQVVDRFAGKSHHCETGTAAYDTSTAIYEKEKYEIRKIRRRNLLPKRTRSCAMMRCLASNKTMNTKNIVSSHKALEFSNDTENRSSSCNWCMPTADRMIRAAILGKMPKQANDTACMYARSL